MQNYFHRLPRPLRSRDNKLIPLLVIGIALIGIFSVVSFISENTDIRNLAATIKPGSIESQQGCYYVRSQCTGPQTPGATGSCKPILVCPTATPTVTPTPTITPTVPVTPTEVPPTPTEVAVPTAVQAAALNCAQCLSEGGSSLCLSLLDKTSFCSPVLEATFDQSRVCAPCKPMPPSPTPIKCVFRPACLDAVPPCAEQPVEGWCTLGSPNIIFQQ